MNIFITGTMLDHITTVFNLTIQYLNNLKSHLTIQIQYHIHSISYHNALHSEMPLLLNYSKATQ